MHARDLAALRDRAERAAADALAWIAPPSPQGPAAEGSSGGAGSKDPGTDGSSDRPAATRAPDGTRSPATADPAPLDHRIAELDALEAELAAAVPDGDALLCTVRARLGGLYAERYGRDPTDDDRSRGLRVLRAARASAALDPRDERASAFHLMRLLMTPGMMAGWDGTLPRLLESFDLGRRVVLGDPELTADLTELRGLVTDLAPALPEDAAESLFWAAGVLERVPAVVRSRDIGQMADLAEQMAQRLPGRNSELMRALSGLVAEFSGAGETDEGGEAEAMTEPSEEETALTFAEAALLLELEVPGTIRAEDLTTLVEEVSKGPAGEEAETAMRAAMSRMAQGVRTGDADRLAEAAELIDAAAGEGSGRLGWMAGLISPGLLAAANTLGGNLTDRDQARARLDALFGPASAVFDSAHATGPGAAGLRICNQCMHLQLRITEALAEEDTERLEELLDELLDLLEETEGGEWQFLVLFLLGQAQLSLATLDGGVTALRTAVAYLEEAAGHPRVPVFARPLMDACWAPALALSSLIEPDLARVSEAVTRARGALEGPASTADQHVRIRQAIVYALLAIHRSTDDPSVLEEAVGELEQARRDLTERTSPDIRQKVLWELAEAYRLRGDRARDDLGAAVSTAQESLRVLAEDVLLQLGAEHGLEVARAGASRGLLAAHWAAVDGRIEEAVTSLENGRGLVLRAAAAAAGVPEQLAARGEAELAEQWRTAVRDLPPGAAPAGGGLGTGIGGGLATGVGGGLATGVGDGLASGLGGGLASGLGGGTPEEVRSALARVMPSGPAPGLAIPSTLRRRALEALRRPEGGSEALRGLLGAPGIGELRDGLRATGADALVYLVPGQGTAGGVAVLVRSTGEPMALPLPGLGALGREPLERYLDAGARRSAVSEQGMDAHAEAHRGWEAALEGLCDWAGPAVLAPILDALDARAAGGHGEVRDEREKANDGPGKAQDGRGQPDAPVRLVLVPCGNLGAVPWHAARLPGPRADARRPYAYACEVAVISYAASGGEFLRAARRGRVPASERAVLVADPSGDLTWAQDEVTALRTAYYTEALLYGWHEDAPANALGTPDDVLSHLPGGPAAPAASLLHLVVHGLAGLRPTDSALHLADPESAAAPDPADTPDLGRLTVTRILDVPAGERAATGPLIVLSACETDLSSRDHDEALTPTTALLARGATDVVGSRWKVSDSASAALMVVFHHHLTVAGLAPPDALRAAQLWMLDHDRRPVPGLTGLLLAETQSDAGGLARAVSWAGFIHQGNPAPRAPVEGRQP